MVIFLLSYSMNQNNQHDDYFLDKPVLSTEFYSGQHIMSYLTGIGNATQFWTFAFAL